LRGENFHNLTREIKLKLKKKECAKMYKEAFSEKK
jgi:hypothetical protein